MDYWHGYSSELSKLAGQIEPTNVTFYGSEDVKKVSSYAVDRDLSTLSQINPKDGKMWLRVAFDEIYYVHKVIIYYRFYSDWYFPRNECVKSIRKYKSCVDNTDNLDVSVHQGEVEKKSCGTLQLTYGLEQTDQIYTLICNAEGDSVKLSKSTGNIAVAEVVVLSGSRIIEVQGKYENITQPSHDGSLSK